jgi:hypothetical protein
MISQEIKDKLNEVDFNTIEFKEEADGGIVIVFSKESEKIKLENIAVTLFTPLEDTKEERDKSLTQLLQLVVESALEAALEGSDV